MFLYVKDLPQKKLNLEIDALFLWQIGILAEQIIIISNRLQSLKHYKKNE